ncbi:MAG: hypothetical protein ABI333_05305 [bacterium]
MPEHQLIGGVLALVGIIDPLIMLFVVVPRLKTPAKVKKLIVTVNTAFGLVLVAVGVAVFFLGGGD